MASDRQKLLIDAFFAPPNKLRLEDLEQRAGAIPEEVLRLFAQLVGDARASDGRPVLLPRVDDTGTVWYALLPDRRARRVIAEDIRAFVGTTYAELGEMSVPLDDNDPIDIAVSEWIGPDGAALRFRVPGSQRASAMTAISSMHQAWSERPRHLATPADGTAVMLRALNRAIAGRDAALAETALEQLRSSGRLSSVNLTFLTIRVLELAGRWSDLLDLEEIGVVLAIPRPRAVTQALLRALYWVALADHLPLGAPPNANQFEASLKVMGNDILPLYSPLFAGVEGLTAGEAILLFALRAAVQEPPLTDEIRRLARNCDADDPARVAIEELWRHLGSSPETELRPTADSAFAVEAVKADLRQAVAERKERVAAAQVALEAFGRGPSLETANDTLGALRQLTPPETDEILSVHRYKHVAGRVLALVPPGRDDLPDGWVSWAKSLRASPDWLGALDILEFAANSWEIAPLLQSETAEDFALTLMDVRSDGGRDAAARSLDHLVPAAEAAVARGLDVTRLGTRLITVLLADDVITEADWNFIVGLLDSVLDGVGRDSYKEVLDEVASSLAERASPGTIDAALETLDVAAFHHSPDPPTLHVLAGAVLGISERFAHRLHRDQVAILQIACKDIGEPYESRARELSNRLLSSESTARKEESLLEGQLVCIYSLQEAAAQRAKGAIESAYPGARVETDSSHVATQRLRRLAQTADQMIVATRAAKHAATGEIDAVLRKRKLRPINPAGKGAASILRALRERIIAS